ncbi:MAG: Mov34/MPN/PAD-1 family protein [Acidobacteriota bacterium]|nr:Mov34/MPN/PAD-1 family protein [Acidobacteriota bacterium]
MSEERSSGDDQNPDSELDDLDIETTGVWEEPLGEGLDPHHDESLVVVPCGKPRGTPRVYIHTDALERIIDHVRTQPKREVGGVLVGNFYTSKQQRVTEVRAAVDAPDAQGGVAHVTFSPENWGVIHQRVESELPGGSVVGWYHSHPGFGVFMSDQDLFIQDNFFDGEGHVALVIDPRKHDVGVFTWQLVGERRAVRPAPGFWVFSPRRETAEKYPGMLEYRMANQKRPEGLLSRLLRR